MTFVKNTVYRDTPFSDETPVEEFYCFLNVFQMHEQCKLFPKNVIRCRSMGILKSQNGHYYLCDIDEQGKVSSNEIIISTVYLDTSPKSAVIPYPVQVFGYLQWRKLPVLYVSILQDVRLSVVIMMNKLMMSVQKKHLAKSALQNTDEHDNFLE